jgi:hypothetical protein
MKFPRRFGWFAVVLVAGVTVPMAAARGDTPTAFGWWTSENPGLPTEPVPTLVPTGSPDGVPSDIPPGGFEVAQEGPAMSYAAIQYQGFGAAIKDVVLDLAPNAADTPGAPIEACPLTNSSGFAPSEGAPLAQGPTYSCAKSVLGVESSNGTTVTFAVAGLIDGENLNIAIVADGTGRLVFEAPGAATIVETPPGSVTPPSGSATTFPSSVAPVVPSGSIVVSPVTAPAASGQVPDISGPTVAPMPQPATARPSVAVPDLSPATPTTQPTLVAVTQPSYTLGTGSAAVGAALVLLGALAVTVRNRKLRFTLPDAGIE